MHKENYKVAITFCCFMASKGSFNFTFLHGMEAASAGPPLHPCGLGLSASPGLPAGVEVGPQDGSHWVPRQLAGLLECWWICQPYGS